MGKVFDADYIVLCFLLAHALQFLNLVVIRLIKDVTIFYPLLLLGESNLQILLPKKTSEFFEGDLTDTCISSYSL